MARPGKAKKKAFNIFILMGLFLVVLGLLANVFGWQMTGTQHSKYGHTTKVNTSGNGVIIIGGIFMLIGASSMLTTKKDAEDN